MTPLEKQQNFHKELKALLNKMTETLNNQETSHVLYTLL